MLISDLFVRVGADASGVQKGMSDAQRALTAFERSTAQAGAASDKLALSMDAAGKRLLQIAQATGGATKGLSDVARSVINASGGMERYTEIVSQLNAETSRTAQIVEVQARAFAGIDLAAGKGRLAVGRLGNSFASLATSAAGVHPVLGNLAGVLGQFAVGGIVTAGVLGGLAALTVAWRRLGEDSRELVKTVESVGREVDALVDSFRGVDSAERTVRKLEDALLDIEDIAKGFVARPLVERLFGGLIGAGGALGALGALATRSMRLRHEQEAILLNKKKELDLAREEADLLEGLNRINTARDREAERRTAKAEREAEASAKAAAELAAAIRSLPSAGEVAALGLGVLATDLERTEAAARKAAEALVLKRRELDRLLSTGGGRGTEAVRDQYLPAGGLISDQMIREAEQRNKEMLNRMQGHWADFFFNVLSKGIASFRDLFRNIKDMFLRMISEMIAQRLVAKLASVIAGLMGAAATAAAQGTAKGIAGLSLGGTAKLGAGLAGAAIGYGLGSATGSSAVGGLGGAAAGALAGNAIAPGVGAVVGALAGLAGGLLGGANAAKEAAKQLRELREAVKLSIESYRARVQGDDLAQRIATAFDEIRGLLMQVDAAYKTSTNNAAQIFARIQSGQSTLAQEIANFTRKGAAGNEGDRQRAELLALFAENERRVREQFEREQRQRKEDLDVRLLRAQGRTPEAEALALRYAQQRERTDLIRSFGAEIDALEAATLATLDQVHALERNTAILEVLANATRNAPSGFRVESYTYAQRLGGNVPMVPGGATGTRPSIPAGGPVFHIETLEQHVTTDDPKVVAKGFVQLLRDTAARTGGVNMPIWTALEYM